MEEIRLGETLQELGQRLFREPFDGLQIRRVVGAGQTEGGHVFSEDFGFTAPFATTLVALQVGECGILLSRDEVVALANALSECICDG